ncbi:MAG: tRNA (guanosine(46)-N7)-methyltransferase TrmB [Clostridia bacterium]|nr:tRNA (guanosine(46)-N7)-methyltransferase TrmB [Clostridia bacterium]
MRMRRKSWTEPLIDSCPYYVDEPASHKGHWREQFPKQQPMYLEIGCGKGVATVAMAHDNPGVNLIAVDEVRHVLAVSIKNTQAEYGDDPVDNLRYTAIDAREIHDTFDLSDGIERIYINFCNPWTEKAKHHKRRLTHPRQLIQYRAFLQPDGEIWFKTDDDMLFTASKRYFGEANFEIRYITDDLHASGFAPNYVSEHEQLYTSRGCRIHFLIARMLPEEPKIEDEVSQGE